MDVLLGWNVDVGFRQGKKWLLDFSEIKWCWFRCVHDEIKFNNEVANFW